MESRIVSASDTIAAPADLIFELIADPARQPEWDGNNNLDAATPGQRVHAAGDVFTMSTTKGNERDNLVTEFEEGRRIAWLPGPVGAPRPGHLWRWELAPNDDGTTTVTHTYDWSNLTDETRFERARWTTSDRLASSIARLKQLAEAEAAR